MSADNGIYIAKFPDGYRWAYGSAIENCDYFPEGSIERKLTLRDYFGRSNVYSTEEEALNAASTYWNDRCEAERKHNQDHPEDYCFESFLEYGICSIGEYEGWDDVEMQAQVF